MTILASYKHLKKLLLISGMAVCLAAIPLFWFYYEPANLLEVDFLDVGQGDAALIKTSLGHNILIDGGPDKTIMKRLGENLPWWDRQIDLLILTHPHADHVTGLVDVVKRYKVKKLAYSGERSSEEPYLAFLQKVREKNIESAIISKPQVIDLEQNCHLEILFAGEEGGTGNNNSMVMKLVYGQTEVLFTGDAEVSLEEKLIEEEIDVDADILKVGHHGSDNASNEDFLAAVSPEFAVIEVGANNSFGHPSGRTIKRLERAGAKVLRTDLGGTIKMKSDGEKIEI